MTKHHRDCKPSQPRWPTALSLEPRPLETPTGPRRELKRLAERDPRSAALTNDLKTASAESRREPADLPQMGRVGLNLKEFVYPD